MSAWEVGYPSGEADIRLGGRLSDWWKLEVTSAAPVCTVIAK